jgi:hypothetical protein
MISNSIANVATGLQLVAQGAEGRAILESQPRETRMVMYLEKMESIFTEDLAPATAKPVAGKPGSTMKGSGTVQSNEVPRTASARRRGFIIRLTARTPLSMDRAISRILQPLVKESKRIAKTMPAFDLVGWDKKFLTSTAAPVAFARPAPLGVGAKEGEGEAPPPPPDTRFEVTWWVAVPQEVEKDARESTTPHAKRGE